MIGKKVYFVEANHVVPGIIVEVCEGKRAKKYVAIFYDDEGEVQKRILRDGKFGDVFGFTIDELVEKIKKEAERFKGDLDGLRKEFETI